MFHIDACNTSGLFCTPKKISLCSLMFQIFCKIVWKNVRFIKTNTENVILMNAVFKGCANDGTAAKFVRIAPLCHAVAFYTATRVIYGTTGLAFSLRDHILPPGRPLARKSHYPQVRCHGLRSNAVVCFVRLQVNRSPLSEVLAPWPGGFSSRPG